MPTPSRCSRIAPRGLDRAFDGFGAGVGEEHRVREGEVDDPLRKRLALRRSVEVRHVHQRRRLLGDCLGQMRMAVAQRVDRDPRGEVQIALAALADQVAPLASHRPHPAARIDGHERGDGHGFSPETKKADRAGPPERAFTERRAEASTPRAGDGSTNLHLCRLRNNLREDRGETSRRTRSRSLLGRWC